MKNRVLCGLLSIMGVMVMLMSHTSSAAGEAQAFVVFTVDESTWQDGCRGPCALAKLLISRSIDTKLIDQAAVDRYKESQMGEVSQLLEQKEHFVAAFFRHYAYKILPVLDPLCSESAYQEAIVSLAVLAHECQAQGITLEQVGTQIESMDFDIFLGGAVAVVFRYYTDYIKPRMQYVQSQLKAGVSIHDVNPDGGIRITAEKQA